jgi:hypothetical protein
MSFKSSKGKPGGVLSPAARKPAATGHADRPDQKRKSIEDGESQEAPARKHNLYAELQPELISEGASEQRAGGAETFDLESLIVARVGALDRGAFASRVTGKV